MSTVLESYVYGVGAAEAAAPAAAPKLVTYHGEAGRGLAPTQSAGNELQEQFEMAPAPDELTRDWRPARVRTHVEDDATELAEAMKVLDGDTAGDVPAEELFKKLGI